MATSFCTPPIPDNLSALTNAQRRAIDNELAHSIIPSIDEDEMWSLVTRLTRQDNRAFLGTILKGIVARWSGTASHRQLDLGRQAPQLLRWSEGMTVIDRHKVLIALLPLARTPQDVSLMLETFGQPAATIGHGHDIDYLIQCDTPPAYFVLLGYMRLNEHNRPLLTAICRRVIQRHSPVAFNAASLFKVFFDLQDVHGTFSLQVHPYELGRLEHDFNLFSTKIT